MSSGRKIGIGGGIIGVIILAAVTLLGGGNIGDVIGNLMGGMGSQSYTSSAYEPTAERTNVWPNWPSKVLCRHRGRMDS